MVFILGYNATMPSVFPYLLSWALLVPFIIRIFSGAYFIHFGYAGLTSHFGDKTDFFRHNGFKHAKLLAYSFSILELVGGIMLLMGLLTQLVAIILLIISLISALLKRHGNLALIYSTDTYILLVAMMICLIIGGAGYYAMDLMV